MQQICFLVLLKNDWICKEVEEIMYIWKEKKIFNKNRFIDDRVVIIGR